MKFRVRAFILCDDSVIDTFDKPNVGVFYNWLTRLVIREYGVFHLFDGHPCAVTNPSIT